MHPSVRETIDYIAERVPYAGGVVFAFKNGETVERSCFGYQDMEAKIPVTDETLFQIASMTKSFCTVLISTLVDEGLLDWDQPVKKYWPDYYAYDPYVSEHMTLTDLASHRSGICSHNKQRSMMTAEESLDLKQWAYRARNLQPCFGFRERFAYQNDLFNILGYLAERVTGKSYVELMQERLAKPIGMEIFFRQIVDENETRYACGYEVDQKTLAMERVDVHVVRPTSLCSGGVVTNLKGIEKWIRFLAAGCVTEDGKRLVSEKTYAKLIHPLIFRSFLSYPDQYQQYSLGLSPSVYRGEKLVYHGGVLKGFRSAMGFFPDLNSGYVVMINSSSGPYAVLKRVLSDIALDQVQPDYHEKCDRMITSFLNPVDMEKQCLPKQEMPEEDLQKYQFDGVFENGYYGRMKFAYEGDGRLRITYGKEADEVAFYRGNGIFQLGVKPAITDVRYNEDGKTLIYSKCEFYSPDVFTRVE